jgi:antitoxin component YwqK of YwqJK toxin-antitoxin module
MCTHLIILLILAPLISLGQSHKLHQGDTINVTDDQNQKQGLWVTFNNDETKIVEQGQYLNNKKDGVWHSYYDDGTTKHEITYKNGKAIGPTRFYYDNGLISEEGIWHIDHWEGNYKFYNKNGRLAYDWNYDQAGNRTGEQKYYHSNGTLKYSGNWEKGQATGTLKIFDDSGKLITERVYDNNGGFVNNLAVNRTERTNEIAPQQAASQTLAKSNTTFNGTGMHTIYNLKGQIEQKGFFVKGKLFNGEQYVYNADKSVGKIIHYQNGEVTQTQEM